MVGCILLKGNEKSVLESDATYLIVAVLIISILSCVTSIQGINPVGAEVGYLGSYLPDSTTISAADWNVSDIPNQTRYVVTFTEYGLPYGKYWTIMLNNYVNSANTSTLVFSETNGTYSFLVWTVAGYLALPSAGTVDVNGSEMNRTIEFTIVKYSVHFTESGLPAGTPWSVVLNGTKEASIGNISFSEPNGTYLFAISSEPGFNATTYSGLVVISGSSVSRIIQWSIVEYLFTIGEKGLPLGTPWSVTITGTIFLGQHINTTLSSTTNSLIFKEPNGSYSYTANFPSGYNGTDLNGSFSLTGASTTAKIVIESQTNYFLIIIVILIPASAGLGAFLMVKQRRRKL